MSIRPSSTTGMTLVEMLVVLAITSMLMVAIGTAIAALYRYNEYTIAESYQVANARTGVDRFVSDAREMTYADDGSYPLAVMKPNRIGFYSDVNRDNSVEYVEFTYTSSTTLVENIYHAGSSTPLYNLSTPDQTLTLSHYVQNQVEGTSTFLYYDKNGNQATTTTPITDIRYITIQSIINIDPQRDPGKFMLRESAALRNIIGQP